MLNLAEKFKIVEAVAPVTGGSAVVGDYISVKNAQRVSIILHITGS